jgi:hypothetical protein
MITTQGEIQTITLAPADPQADPPVPAMTTAVVQMVEPSVGSMTVVVPTVATGGLALGKCRVLVDQG